MTSSALLGAVVRTTPWTAMTGAVLVAVVCAWQSVPLLAAAAVALSAAAAFDEPSAEVAAGAPVPLATVRATRLAVASPAVLSGWLLSRWVAPHAGGPAGIEVAGLVAVTLAAAAVGLRYRPAMPGGLVAGPAVVAVIIAGADLLRTDGRWLALTAAGVVVVALAGRDR